MNEKIANLFKTTRTFLGKHSPEILTGLGVAGLLSTTVLAVKATPKALQLIELKKKELETDKLTVIETMKVAWRPYIPAGALAIVGTSCIIGASAVNYKRNAALATAYAISEQTLLRYRDKVIETLGEKEDKKIKEQIAQDQLDNKPITNEAIILTSKGNTLCMDSVSGRYFKSDIDTIKKTVNKLNRDLTYQHYVSLNDFYYELGLDGIKNGSAMGWNLDQGLIEIVYSTCLAQNDEPCIVIDFTVAPRYDYDKFM